MSKNIGTLQDAIHLAEGLKHLLEKELGYDWEVTDELQNIIEALQYDLDEERGNG